MVGIFWVVSGGKGYFWVVVGGGTVYDSPFEESINNERILNYIDWFIMSREQYGAGQ